MFESERIRENNLKMLREMRASVNLIFLFFNFKHYIRFTQTIGFVCKHNQLIL